MILKCSIRYWLVVLLLSFIGQTKAQNLVPNGDFELFSNCPNDFNQLGMSFYWINPTTYGSPDYFNTCALGTNAGIPYNFFSYGYQNANSGNGYSGIFLWHKLGVNVREYVEIKLTSKLLANKTYHLVLFANLANHSGYTINKLNAYFSDTLINSFNNGSILPFTHQVNLQGNYLDTLDWTQFSGDYTAIGGEEYLIIGNFFPDSLTDTVFFQTAIPSTQMIYSYIDDVNLTEMTEMEEIENISFELFPNPSNEQLQLSSSKAITRIEIYNLAGEKICDFSQLEGIYKFTIEVSKLSTGIYNCLVYDKQKGYATQKFSVVKL